MRILDGRLVASQLKERLKADVRLFEQENGRAPCLAVVAVGEDPASQIYLKHKEKASGEVGLRFQRHNLKGSSAPEALDDLIDRLNADAAVDGILVQLPVPPQFSVERIVTRIAPDKDADGFHPENLGLLMVGRPRVASCTPLGIMMILEHYKIPLAGRHAVVVGRSQIVGRPMGQLLINGDATVTTCHSRTRELTAFTRQADIVVVAAGKPHLLKRDAFKKGAVVIDVGMHRVNGKIIGDVDPAGCEGHLAALTPVPGGVGPMTVACLIQNTLTLAKGHK